ncbi:hypothetical protein CDAR_482561 [Caerostris darwini]|uniref:Uncharacterized protein n=1 Tax=Caerostris darwini TaxID=1538125 RepID=A0AAV4RI72_9ARAC|nr:hypothetical protein CDAR_482561 [Caerostris darwini]
MDKRMECCHMYIRNTLYQAERAIPEFPSNIYTNTLSNNDHLSLITERPDHLTLHRIHSIRIKHSITTHDLHHPNSIERSKATRSSQQPKTRCTGRYRDETAVQLKQP